MSISEYRQFIACKTRPDGSVGFEPKPINPMAKTHQRVSLEFALRRGKSAAFLDTGLGKSFIELEFARQCADETGKPSLILTPLAVAGQMIREGHKFGIDARQIREPEEVGNGVMVANYERLPKLDPSKFGAIVLDECFAAGTPVDVVNQDGSVSQKHIENIRVGDSIMNASGVDRVSDVHRREVPYAIRITVGCSVFVCSPNHPIFTQRGWTPAQCLQPGDQALVTSEAVRLVREGVFSEVSSAATRTILRAVLLSEMADAPAGDCGEGSFTGSRGEARREAVCVATVGRSESQSGDRSDHGDEPIYDAGGSGKNIQQIESHEARTFRAWGQWSRDDEAAIDLDGCTRDRLDGGISFITGATGTGLSDALQDRFGAAGKENRRRGGWSVAYREAEGSGRKEGCEAGFARVDSLEVLELGNPDLERLRDADGKLYFYDLGGTRHPSFSVHGLLVHNSSILKSFAGRTRNMLMDAFRDCPFKLAATATPSPNDHMELGNHAEFLGVMRQQEMLSKWFINDTSTASQDWRLKGHAVDDFWSWVASWSRCATMPSDLGGNDAGYVLPDIDRRMHEVAADRQDDTGGLLFRIPELSATSFHNEKKLTLKARCEMAVELATHDRPVTVWCETNEESAFLVKAIPDAREVRGDMAAEEKERRLLGFVDGDFRVIVTKPKLAGFGVNWQHCAHAVFASISFSYEQHYQAVRRSHRFGQMERVRNDVVIADTETAIWRAIHGKSEKHEDMKRQMAKAMRRAQHGSETRVKYDRPLNLAFPEWLKSEVAK